MALQLSKELDTGFTGDYWKITKIDFSPLDETSVVHISLFKDATARGEGKIAIETKAYIWNGTEHYPFTVAAMDVNNPITIAYDKIKTYDEFSGAVDV